MKPDPNPFPLNAFCAYANAGLVAARGEVVLFVVDYTDLPEHVVAMHAEFHKHDATGRAGLMAPHQYYTLDVHPDFAALKYTHDPADAERYAADVESGRLDRFMWSIGTSTGETDPIMRETDPKLKLADGPVPPVFFHAKNESVRLKHCLAINGWDEDLDGTHPYQDSDFSDRLTIKQDVRWMVTSRPEMVARIINPRHVFPFARRVRTPESNYEIWQRKKAAGYPGTVNNWNLRTRRVERGITEAHWAVSPDGRMKVVKKNDYPVQSIMVTAEFRKLRVAMVYGEFSSAIHPPFDIAKLADAGLTGSESSFFNLARTLAERGHEVVVFCVCTAPTRHESGFEAVPIQALRGLREIPGLDAVIAWNEPDYFQYAPAGVPRIVDQQLNDWGYCKIQPSADVFVFPSKSSLGNHVTQLSDLGGIEGEKHTRIIPNSVDLDLFSGPAPERHPHRVVYASSPDRGLHHLLAMWPAIRKRVPDAELKIFYRIGPWLERAWNSVDKEVSRRAVYVGEALRILERGDWGVDVVGAVSNREMARQFRMATALAYPCDPVRYTEGFGCSVLDACAGGCLPIISDADALAEVHDAAMIIPGKVQDHVEDWKESIVRGLTWSPPEPNTTFMRFHAADHSRQKVTDQWEVLLRELYAQVRRAV